MRNHVLENTDENERGRTILEKMKIYFGVSLPTSESIECFRICGGNESSFEFTGLNRHQSAGRYIGDTVRLNSTSEAASEMRTAIMDIDSTSKVMIAEHLLVPGTMLMGYAVPLNVDGKICVVSCTIRMEDSVMAANGVGNATEWNRTELECALKVVDAFKHKVSMTEETMRFTQAHVREYLLVDYPRKFMWHDSLLLAVKNTFLHVKSSYYTRESALEDGDAECVNDKRINDINPIKLAYNANEGNLKLFERVFRDVALVGEHDSISDPVDSAWESMPTLSSRRSCSSSTIAPRERAFPSKVHSSSNEIFEAWSPSTKKSGNKNVGENTRISKRCGGALKVTSEEMKSEESEDGRELLEESHPADFRSFYGARSSSSFSCSEGHESQHFIPPYLQSPTPLRVDHHASPQEKTSCPTTAPSNNEPSRCSASESGSNAPPAPCKLPKLRVGDHVELHSFPHATWMCGLRARVKYVMRGDQRHKNRAGRVTIVYDEPGFQKNPLYRNTIPMTNVRLIGEEEE